MRVERKAKATEHEILQHGCCREDRATLARILRQLAQDIDAGSQHRALQDKSADGPSIAQADRVTGIIPASGEVVRKGAA